MEVQGSLGRQIQGISQQPPAVRLDGQCTDMVNMIPDVVEGTKSRVGSTHIARLMASGSADMATHHYRRGDGDEEYFFIHKKGELPKIFDKLGRECAVTAQDSPLSYLAEVVTPREDVQYLTIADVTFMLNRRKVVKAGTATSEQVGATALVFSAFGQYNTTYRILIGGQEAAKYITKTGESAADAYSIRTEEIATQLFASLSSWSGLSAYNAYRDGTTIVISRKDGSTNWSITTDDGAKGKDLVAIKSRVASTDLLPSRAPVGYKVQIWPTGSKPESRYWLAAESADGNLVQWKETLGAGVIKGFDLSTMPYIVERTNIVNGVAQFTIRQGDWVERRVGDDVTNPLPSFIDTDAPQKIGSMFMVQNRLCFTSSEAVSSSRTSSFFDFFRTTAVAAVDTDPFDVYSDASEVYQLRHSATLDGDTVLFSDTSQFLLPGDKALTKENALLRPVTTFEVNTRVKPVVTGESIMFATTEGAYSSIREFYTDSYSDTKKAQPITSHVNKLIEGSIIRMVASSNVNRLFCMTNKDTNKLYVYDWLWQGTDKAQSAWHIWLFPEGTAVRSLFYSLETLYMLVDRGSTGLFLESFDLGDALAYGLEDRIRMDRQVSLDFTYDANEDRWVSSTLPYTPSNTELMEAVITQGWPEYVGGAFLFEYDSANNRIITTFELADTSVGKAKAVVGQMYSCEFEPTPVVIKDSRDRVSYIDVPVVGLVHLNLDKYPDFEVHVTNNNTGNVRVAYATNRRGGALNNIVGYVKPKDGVFKFPIRTLSTDSSYRIKVLSPHTLQLRDIEWEGSYNPTKRRV